MNHAEVFLQHRPLLFSIAYRMLGRVMDAEDAVQECFLRWQQHAPGAEVQNARAYLVSIVTRLCIDQLRSAAAQRETYIGPWLPEPLLTPEADSPAEAAALAESLSLAFLMLLEKLSPVERAVYLLREVFDFSYGEIARMVDKTEAHCRQMVRRARGHLARPLPRFSASAAEQKELVEQFGRACLSGDLTGLLAVLAEDVRLYSDGGGKVPSAIHPIDGRERVARFLLGVMGKLPPGFSGRLARANGQPAIVGEAGGHVYNVMLLDIRDGAIRGIYNILNPDKLRGL